MKKKKKMYTSQLLKTVFSSSRVQHFPAESMLRRRLSLLLDRLWKSLIFAIVKDRKRGVVGVSGSREIDRRLTGASENNSVARGRPIETLLSIHGTSSARRPCRTFSTVAHLTSLLDNVTGNRKVIIFVSLPIAEIKLLRLIRAQWEPSR